MVNKAMTPQRQATNKNRTKVSLGKQAIRMALDGEWGQAAEANRAILDINPNDSEAANRLAKALLELGDYTEARSILESLLVRAPNNNIARKNLARLGQLQERHDDVGRTVSVAGNAPGMFIAESGKSCTTTLMGAGDSAAMAAIGAGDAVALTANGDGVAVATLDGRNLGTLQRRLGRRLNKLMAGGNSYAAAVVGSRPGGVSIMIRETAQAAALRHVISFPADAEGRVRLSMPAAVARPTVSRASEPDAEADVMSDADGSDEERAFMELAGVEDAADDASEEGVPTLEDDLTDDTWTPPAAPEESESDWE